MKIIMKIDILKDKLEIYGFEYPQSFIKALELNLLNFDLWYIMNEEMTIDRLNGLRERYPSRKLIPFAKRDDNDDIACFEIGKDESVQIIHDFSSEGYEQRKKYDDFWDWLKDAINEMVEFNRDEEKYSKLIY